MRYVVRLALIAATLLPVVTFSQIGVLRGRVIDAETGEPLPGAQVEVLGLPIGAVCDADGRFFLLNVPVGTYSLKVTFIGFQSYVEKEISVTSGVPTDIVLELPSKMLAMDEVVLTREPASIPSGDETDEITSQEEIIIEDMKWGNIFFNTPKSMDLNETRGIHLLLSLVHSVKELSEMIMEVGEVRDREVRIAQIMSAKLTGSSFKVDLITEELQVVDLESKNEWRWEITALKPGTQRLYLSLHAIVNIDGRDRPHALLTLHEEIEIRVSWGQRMATFFGNNWHWLWTGMVVPLVGWLLQYRKTRKQAALDSG